MDVSHLDPSKFYLVSGKTLAENNRRIARVEAGENIGRTPGLLKRGAGPAGFSLAARRVPKVPQSPSDNPVPFGVSLSTVGMSANPNRASVYWNSSLFLNEILNSTQTIMGLATEAGAPNAFTFDYGNDLIWVEVLLTSGGAFSSATIKSWGQGGTWVVSDPPQEYGTGSGPFEMQTQYDVNGNPYYTQYILRRAIFISQTSTIAPYPVFNIQLVNTNLIFEGGVWNGPVNFNSGVTPVVVPYLKMVPFGGGYVNL